MLCCVSRKATARPNNQNRQKHQKSINSEVTGSSTSGFSESSSASSGDFPSSRFSTTSSSSGSTSGFSSASPPSIRAFADSSSDSSSSGSEFSNNFNVPSNYLENSSSFTQKFIVRDSSSVKSFPPISPKRLQTFSPTASARKPSNSGHDVSFVENEKMAEDEPPVLLPCAICTRTFKPQSLEKHTRICEQSAIKKRKPFDSAKQRIQGTDLAEFLPKETIKKKIFQEEKPPMASKGLWKQTHDEFLRAIRAARGETIDVAPQRQVVASSHVTVGVPTRPNEKGMCPTCNRQFSIKSYERHVAWCKEHATRVPISPATNIAKERLEARMKYRAPLLKNRRLTNREKYSPGSAINLPNFTSKNSLTNSRTKESVSTPNCNNKSNANEATIGSGTQNHRKATTTARRSGQSREGISSGPMKSRLSDRSSRPSAEIESGLTTNLSSCPIPPRINVNQHWRLSPTRAITPNDSASPLPSSRNVNKSESSRIASQDCGSSRKIYTNDRRSIELNIFNGEKYHQRQNIVSARSHGHPKVNDITINDEVIGMTVHRCGTYKNDEREAEERLITWKEISEDHNLIKSTKFLRLNDSENLNQSMQKIKLENTEPIVQNELNCNLKSSHDFKTFDTSGIKKLNQTYLIRESLDTKKNLSEILRRRMRRSVVNSSRREFFDSTITPRNNVFRDLGNDARILNRFNAEVNVTNSPLQSREEDDELSEENINRAISPVLSGRTKLVPLDLKIIHNDEISDQEDTSRSGGSTVSSLQTCRKTLTKRTPKLKPIIGHELIFENSMNLRILEERNCKDLKDNKDSFKSFQDIDLKVNSDGNNQLLDTSRSPGSTATAKDNCMISLRKNTPRMKLMNREKFDSDKQLNCECCNEENAGSYGENIEIIKQKFNVEGNSQLLDTSRSLELKPKCRKELACEMPLDFRFYNDDNTRRKHFSKSIEKFEEIINTDEINQLLDTSGSSKSTVTSTKISRESLKQNSPKMRVLGEKACDRKASKSLDEDDCLSLMNTRHSFQDVRLKINYDKNLESLDTSRSAGSAITAIKSCRKLSLEETPKLMVETELFCQESLNDNSCHEKNDEYSINRRYKCSDVEVSEKEIKNVCIETLENKLSVEKSVDTHADQSFVETVEFVVNSLESEKIKKTSIEQPKNYQRCGTYVIERATNFDVTTKHPASDESLEEKPLFKKRRTEQEMTNEKIEKTSISNEILKDNTIGDSKLEKNLTNFHDCPLNSLVKSGKALESTESKIKSIDNEIHEKYVNENFYYDSDNCGDNNLVKDNDPEASMITQEKMCFNNQISSYDLNPKAFSDSIVSRQTSSTISTLKSKKERAVLQDSVEMRRKLKKKMNLLRGSTDNLISSIETSSKIINEKSSSITISCEIEKTPQIEEETIEKLDFKATGNIAVSKASCCAFLPEIPFDRISTKKDNRKKAKCVPLDCPSFWEKARRNSSTRLINLDPPKYQETRIKNARQSNIGNLPPAVAASFRKERRRSSDRDSRMIWNNYVRRRPDFNLVLTGRTGSCKDYDPFLLAERQMNELLSDTCSDQSFTDSPGNRRSSSSTSAPNYPLSHSSAFVKYPDPVTRNLNNPEKSASSIAQPSDFDDLATDFSSDSTETNSISREILADLEDSRTHENGFDHESKSKNSRDHVLGRRVILDKSKALGTNEIIEDSNRKNSQTNEKARKILDKVSPKVVRSHVTRSSSVRANSAPKAPERMNNNSSITTTNKMNSRSSPGSSFNNRNNNYTSLSGSNISLSSIVSSEVEVKRSNSLFDEFVSSFEDDTSGTYPSLRSLLKNDSLSVSSPVQSNRLRNGQISDEELSSPDSYQRQDHSKINADSAYSSLNRKYSNNGRSMNDVGGRLEEDSPQRRRDGDAGSISSAKSKLSKFCHECGCKFPETAKFCCECGIRRLAL